MVDVHLVSLVSHLDHVLPAKIAAPLELPRRIPGLVFLVRRLHLGADVGPGSGGNWGGVMVVPPETLSLDFLIFGIVNPILEVKQERKWWIGGIQI